MTNSILPPGFEILDPFAADWALETQDQRYVKRRNTSAEALRAFYDAMLPHIEKILDEVDRCPNRIARFMRWPCRWPRSRRMSSSIAAIRSSRMPLRRTGC
jgi:hypothetical protein